MAKTNDDDEQRTVTVTVAVLRRYEAAVRASASARYRKNLACDKFERAKADLEQAAREESATLDAEVKATGALHGKES